VWAVESGIVAFAGELKPYGNLILIRHPGGYVSAYAGVASFKVRRNDGVERGQVIATMSDEAWPYLHFELSKDGRNVDPRQYLAAR
jgi:murein DD-endopeptidase MepM/ murein hydrolase activator NlpD